MRGVVSAFGALMLAATISDPVAAQCYGPECDRYRSGPPGYYGERPTQQPNSFHRPQPYRPAPYQQGRQYEPMPHSQPNFPQPNFSQPNYPQQPQPTYPQHSQPNYQPGYQPSPRPPVGYSNAPAGVTPPMQGYRQVGPGVHVRTKVTKLPKGAKYAAPRHQPAPNSHHVVRGAPPQAGGGQITISVAEYRDLQNQARELQRLLSARGGAPNKRSVFPDIPPPGTNKPARL